MTKTTVDDMMDLQFDNTNRKAMNVLPVLLNLLQDDLLSDDEQTWKNRLKQWDYQHDKSSTSASFFDAWSKQLEYETWADEFGIGDDQYLWPYFNQLDEMICFQPNSTWFDNKTTPNKETLLNVCKSSFSSTVEQFSSIDSIAQQWQFFQGTDISHIAKIPGFGRMDLPTSGGKDIVNAIRKTEGPSWRLVIEMDDKLEPFGIYPGGQSGYPGSYYYDNFVDDWVNEHFYALPFSNSVDDIEGHRIICK